MRRFPTVLVLLLAHSLAFPLLAKNPSLVFLRVAKQVDVSVEAKGVLKADGATAMAARSGRP